jgi:hypothetical protein
LHFVQINLKTCESYSLERLGEEVNNIRLILTSRGERENKDTEGSPATELCEILALAGWGPEGAMLSHHFPCGLSPGLGVT